MNWFRSNSLGLLLALIMGLNLFVGARQYAADTEDERAQAYKHLALMTTVLEQIRHHYVEEDKTTYPDLIQGGIRGMLATLDPHSQYMDSEMYAEMKDDTNGEFGGLGVVIAIKDGDLTVVAPMEDTPGFRAGIMSGDKIISIDGASTEGLPLQDAVKLLRGNAGSEVTLKLLRVSSREIKELTLMREKIVVKSIKDVKILDDSGIGYLRITAFNQRTGVETQEALDQLIEKKMKGLIIDLRNNPGGLLSAAIEVSEKFLKRNDLVVYTQGRGSMSKHTYNARGAFHYTDLPVAILINGGSASASEIVAGALQDHKRAVLVGERSFGKGSVQSILPMDDGSAIRLTTAKYYTPSERVIHNHGIEPDVLVEIDLLDWQKLQLQRTRLANYEPTDPDEIEFLDQNIPDTQLDRALDVLKGILIFNKHTQLPIPTSETIKTAAAGR